MDSNMINAANQNMLAATHRTPAASQAAKKDESSPMTGSDGVSISGGVSKSASAKESGYAEHVPGEMLVRFKGDSTPSSFFRKRGLEVVKKIDIPDIMQHDFKGSLYHVKINSGENMADVINQLNKDKRVSYAEPNYIYRVPKGEVEQESAQQETPPQNPPNQNPSQPPSVPQFLPNDLNPKLWDMHNTGQTGGKVDTDIDAPEAWHITTGNNDANAPILCIIDTGVDYTHPELKNNVWTNPNEIPGDGIDNDGNGFIDDVHGYDFANKDGDPIDDQGHGTHCAGTIGAEGNNSEGMAGVNWKAKIMPLKFLTSSGSGTLADAMEAIIYSTKMGARISSNSWGGGGYSQSMYDAIAAFPGLFIAAAGNESNNNDTNPSYPASYQLPNVISVASTDHKDQISSFSNYGKKSVHLGAPGSDIYSLKPGDKYATLSGTSMACPHVAGAALLILAKYPDLTNEQLKARLMNTTDPIPALKEKTVSGGRLNINNALEEDNIAPNQPGDFKAVESGALAVKLGWIAPGDDADQGTASRYELRFSDKPIVEGQAGPDQVSWNDAAQAAIDISPKPAGQAEECTVSVSPQDKETRLYYALKAYDNMGNASPITGTFADIKPATIVFKDDMEAGSDNWVAEKPWGLEDAEGHGKVMSDSPGGQYADNANTSVTSKDISLKDLKRAILSFEEKHGTEARYDICNVEIKKKDSPQWDLLAKMDGAADWNKKSFDLGDYVGSDVQIRFRFTSDSSQHGYEGWSFDNVTVAGE